MIPSENSLEGHTAAQRGRIALYRTVARNLRREGHTCSSEIK